MRFKVEEFPIKGLLLDESNYRFFAAANQQDCIKKIYESNKPYFKNLMKSLAERDLSEPLLVYKGPDNKNIIMDGNRRASALKVLDDDQYAPDDAIKRYAQELRAKCAINFLKIQAQVSDNKYLIAETVYERHAGDTKGTNRINWNAFAAARFGFDKEIGDEKEWHIMTLLVETEEKYEEIKEFTRTENFYETFRRIVRAAIDKDIISKLIFANKSTKIKKTAPKELIKDAIDKTYQFLRDLKEKKLSLSRKEGGDYADKENVDKYLNELLLSPDTLKSKGYQNSGDNPTGTTAPLSSTDDHTSTGERRKNNSESQGRDYTPTATTPQNENKSRQSAGITESKKITDKLNELDLKKLSNLYKSLCTVSLKEHPILLYVGAWSFFEVLAKNCGNSGENSFRAYYDGKAKEWGLSDSEKKRKFTRFG
jgi:hypothetical protein